MIVRSVRTQLDDLPDTFTRLGNPYGQWNDTETQAVSDFTLAADAIVGSVQDFGNAQWGWLDVWGLLLGVARNRDEGDPVYANRITGTILAWVGTIPAIEAWGQLIFGAPVAVAENLPSVGYVVTLPSGITTSQINAFAVSLARVRPAGVPFSFNQQTGGVYLDTINFLDTWETMGSYIDDDLTTVAFTIPSTTVNALPLLPDIYLVDPTLNPPA